MEHITHRIVRNHSARIVALVALVPTVLILNNRGNYSDPLYYEILPTFEVGHLENRLQNRDLKINDPRHLDA